MAHIGVLGLSLPYVLELMEPAGDRASSVTPVELIITEPTETSASADRSTPAERTVMPVDVEPPEAPPAKPSEKFNSSSDSTVESDVADTPKPTQAPEAPAPVSDGDHAAANPQRNPKSSQAQPTPDSAETGNETAEDALPTLPTTPTEPTELPTEPPTEPPIVEGEQLPQPASGSEAEQIAALRVVGTEIRSVQDVKDEPPKLLSSNPSVALQPDTLGCGRVDFSQGALTYRIAVDADNSLRSVTPLTESASARAIACLIESAGFTFEAAIFDGTPVTDDSLLLTVEVVESTADE
ncbi:MAG: hypothetical protein WBC73_01665 [Phormidesmis sp.]